MHRACRSPRPRAAPRGPRRCPASCRSRAPRRAAARSAARPRRPSRVERPGRSPGSAAARARRCRAGRTAAGRGRSAPAPRATAKSVGERERGLARAAGERDAARLCCGLELATAARRRPARLPVDGAAAVQRDRQRAALRSRASRTASRLNAAVSAQRRQPAGASSAAHAQAPATRSRRAASRIRRQPEVASRSMSHHRQAVTAIGAPAAIGPYSHAVRRGGLLFCSGQIPLDPDSGELVGATPGRAGARAAWRTSRRSAPPRARRSPTRCG